MTKIDFQGLFTVLAAAEAEPNFDMSSWIGFNWCGTTHCMIGAFCTAHQDDKLQLETSISSTRPIMPSLELAGTEAIAARFGITPMEARWLFIGILKNYTTRWSPATGLSKEQALKRLRKFIYYKLHKQELIIEKGRNNYIIDNGRDAGHIGIVNTANELASV